MKSHCYKCGTKLERIDFIYPLAPGTPDYLGRPPLCEACHTVVCEGMYGKPDRPTAPGPGGDE